MPSRPIDAMAYLSKAEPIEALSQEQWVKHTVRDFAGIMATLIAGGDRRETKDFHDTMMSWVINKLQDEGVDITKGPE